jgi:hypothetical protein
MTDFLLSRIERRVNDYCRVRASTRRAESFLQRFAGKNGSMILMAVLKRSQLDDAALMAVAVARRGTI